MNMMQAFKMAYISIVGNKLRSFLTMLGVIIGVCSVIVAVGFAEGSTKSIMSSIESLGTNLIQITITGRNSNRNVSYEDLIKFADDNFDYIAYLAPTVSSQATVKYETTSKSTTMIGTSSEYAHIKSTFPTSGRYISSVDLEFYQKVVVLGSYVAKEFFGARDPVGEKIKINGELFTVIGVLEEKDGSQEQTQDDQIIIPVTVAQRLSRNAVIRNFSLNVTDAKYMDKVMEDITAFLTKIYNDSNAFRVFNQMQMLSTLNSVTGTLSIILAGISGISLVVGGISIMNIMLVSVTERTKEIGIRKAIGAKRRDILIQFLIEAILLTGTGGALGILFGVGIIKFIIGGLNIVPAVYSTFWILLSFGISVGIGILFGMFPAYKAAKLSPIEALRTE